MAEAARRVLVTRPEPGASTSAAALAQAGYEPIVLPLTEIRPLAVSEADLPGEFAAVAVTSANALRCAPRNLLDRLVATPLFSVGEATTHAARQAGFSNVETGPGDAEGLARLVADRLSVGQRLLHLCGRVRTPELERRLMESGLSVNVVETYDTLPVTLSQEQIEGLKNGGPLHAVLAHSAGGAKALAGIEARPDLAAVFSGILHVCISSRAATPLTDGKRRIVVADNPTEVALIAALKAAS